MEDWLNSNTLFASLLWGSIGMGLFIFGKRRREWVPMAGGVALIAVSYLVANWLWMSVASLALIGGVWFLLRREA
jgi:hypothetical protein